MHALINYSGRQKYVFYLLLLILCVAVFIFAVEIITFEIMEKCATHVVTF